MMLCKLIDKSILLLLFAILFVHYSPSLAFADDENRIASTGDESVGSESLISEPSFSPDDTITGFRFDGLRRTKEHYLKSELKHYLGRKAGEIDPHEIETELQKIGLFDAIVITIEADKPNSAILNITLKEKWSLIPIPMIAYIDELMGGLFLMDMNAFGENDKFIVGGFGSKTKVRGVMSFSTPSVVGRPGLTFSGSGAKDKVSVYDMDKNKVLEYRSINYGLGVKVNYKFSLRSGAYMGVKYDFADNDVDDAYSDYDGSRGNMDLRVLSLTAGYNYEIADWNGWFLSKVQVSVDGELGLNHGDTVIPSMMITLRYQRPIFFDRLRFISHAAGYYSYHSIVPMFKKGRVVGVDILPSRFMSPVMVAGGSGLEVGIYRFSWASFSIGAQYQVVYGQDWDKTMAFHHGWSAGLHVNLSKVAFPAFSLGVAHDVGINQFKFALGMGMSM